MSLLNLPNELLLDISKYLDKDDAYSLLQTSRYFSILTLRLLEFACDRIHCVTALYLAAADGNEDMIRSLLDKGAPIMLIQYETGEKPSSLENLTLAQKDTVIKHLLEKRAESIILHKQGLRTAMYLAVVSRKTVLAKLLLSKGANPSAPNCISPGPIYAAIRNKDEGMVRLLLDNGANIEGPRGTNIVCHCCAPAQNSMALPIRTPLSYAGRVGAGDIIKMLVERGADINSRNNNGRTALYLLIGIHNHRLIQRRCGTISLLLELGADPNILDGYGCTALDIAKSRCPPAVLALLESYGAVHSQRWLELSNKIHP